MTWAERFPSIQQPEMEDIAEWIGQPLFLELRDWMADTYGVQPLVEYSCLLYTSRPRCGIRSSSCGGRRSKGWRP